MSVFHPQGGAGTAGASKPVKEDTMSEVRVITAEIFRKATGHYPEQDDLTRCNCKNAGKWGHINCGWDDIRGMPNFIPGFSKVRQAL